MNNKYTRKIQKFLKIPHYISCIGNAIDLLLALRGLGVSAIPILDWSTSRLYPSFINENRALSLPFTKSLEFGSGDGSGAYARSKVGCTTTCIGDRTLVLDFVTILKIILRSVRGFAGVKEVYFDEAAHAIAGSLLTPVNGVRCPLQSELDPNNDGLDLLVFLIQSLAYAPYLVIPDGMEMIIAEKSGFIRRDTMRPGTRVLLDSLLNRDVVIQECEVCNKIFSWVNDRLMVMDVRLSEFSDVYNLLRKSEEYQLVVDSRALAHAPDIAINALFFSMTKLAADAVIITDGIMSAYNYAFDHIGMQALINARNYTGVTWFVVIDGGGHPVGAVAGKGAGLEFLPSILNEGYNLIDRL